MKKSEKSTASKLPEITFLIPECIDHEGCQVTSAIGSDGKEYPDPIPTAPPIGYQNPPDLMTMIRTMIQSEALRQKLAQEDFETFEEADDFEIEDDPIDPLTPYEKVFEPNPALAKKPIAAEAAGVAQTPPAAPAGTRPPEVVHTSGVGDTSPTTQQAVKPAADKAV